MNLEKQKENFKNHVAKFNDYGNIKIIDFKAPDTNNYRIRFLFEEDYCRLHISGDLGELIATNYNNMTYEKFSDFVNNIGYFEEKIDCHSRSIYFYDEIKARLDLKKYIEENDLVDFIVADKYEWETEEEKINYVIDDILQDFSDRTGVSSEGYDKLMEIIDDAYEIVGNLGKKETGILELYMLAFKLAKEQLDKKIKLEDKKWIAK